MFLGTQLHIFLKMRKPVQMKPLTLRIYLLKLLVMQVDIQDRLIYLDVSYMPIQFEVLLIQFVRLSKKRQNLVKRKLK